MTHATAAFASSDLKESRSAKYLAWGHTLFWLVMWFLMLSRYSARMDIYDKAISFGAAVMLSGMAFRWLSGSWSMLSASILALLAQVLYAGQLSYGGEKFFLKYLLASQSAISWMSVYYFLAWGAYGLGNYVKAPFAWKTARVFTWLAVTFGLTGLLVRWYESYLYGSDIGHIPISNLYEVIVVFCLFTTWMYLYFESRFKRPEIGVWLLGMMSGWVVFLLWYAMTRQAHEIQPLVPALQSYWMKIHVPANFIGYGGFTLAAMVGAVTLVSRRFVSEDASATPNLLSHDILMEWMYRSIAVGFAFFTIATILGAVWAAEAWGGYWSWDPKEVWALIVWLNYAAWLHFRLTKGSQGQYAKILSLWAVLGFFITLFAFLGVNMFLSGLHSYGKL